MDRSTWYRTPEVMFNIVGAVRDRETAFISDNNTVRHIFARHSDFLKNNMRAYHFDKKEYNLFYSLAKYTDAPMLSYNPKVRAQQAAEWNKKAKDHIVSYDLGLDFDAPNHKQWRIAYEDCKAVFNDLNKYGVPFSIKWSGTKGFHIRIPYYALPKLPIKDFEDWTKGMGEMLSMVYKAQLKKDKFSLDLGVFDLRRLWKCDYSWTIQTGLIALPLTDEQFINFDLSMVTPKNVLKTGVRNKADLMRPGSYNNFQKYCIEVLGINV